MSRQVITTADYKKLSDKIRDDFFIPINKYETTVFLCGAHFSQKKKIRFKLDTVFNDSLLSFQYRIIYPEDIFNELLYSSNSKDLLSLENILADSVDVLLIIPERPGSYTELGAFANDAKLRKKIICVIDEEYKKSKSFINQGPVKLIKNVNNKNVIYIDPNKIEMYFSKIVSAINNIKERTTKKASQINILQLDNFLLPAIYLLGQIYRSTIISLVKAVINDHSNAFDVTIISLAKLTKKKYIELIDKKYKLTNYGYEKIQKQRTPSSRVKMQNTTVALDELRLEFLNLKLRNKKLMI